MTTTSINHSRSDTSCAYEVRSAQSARTRELGLSRNKKAGRLFLLVLLILALMPVVLSSRRFDVGGQDPSNQSWIVLLDEVDPPLAGTPVERAADGMEMVLVPGGVFEMGSDIGDSDERPVHEVYLHAFWFDRLPINAAQYSAFLNSVEMDASDLVDWLDLGDPDCPVFRLGEEYAARNGKEQNPMVEVSWHGAVAYCEWANTRLPTEAEWEYVIRGPSDVQPEILSAGAELPEGSSWCGALDQVGNLREWLADWYRPDYYHESPELNPTGPSTGTHKALRGGVWNLETLGTHVTKRDWDQPEATWNSVGFRCAMTAQGI